MFAAVAALVVTLSVVLFILRWGLIPHPSKRRQFGVSPISDPAVLVTGGVDEKPRRIGLVHAGHIDHLPFVDHRRALLFPATLSIAAATSSTDVMLYRSKVLRVRWPEMAMATVSWVPDRIRFRSALRRRS